MILSLQECKSTTKRIFENKFHWKSKVTKTIFAFLRNKTPKNINAKKYYTHT